MTFLYLCSMINHTNHTFGSGGKIMKCEGGRYAWIVKIGERGQFVIPKEARDFFDFQPGDEMLVLGDEKKGLAILPKKDQSQFIARIINGVDDSEEV